MATGQPSPKSGAAVLVVDACEELDVLAAGRACQEGQEGSKYASGQSTLLNCL